MKEKIYRVIRKEAEIKRQSTIKSMIEVISRLNHINLEIIKIKAECSEF